MGFAALDWSIVDRIREFAADLRSVLGIRFNKRPLRSVEDLVEFIHTRAAYVAQTSLYGYVKTRMGTRYPLMFQDDAFAASINVAKWRVFAACLSDLTVFAVASAAAAERLGSGDANRLANSLLFAAAHRTFTPEVAELSTEAIADFAARVRGANWTKASVADAAFTESPAALLRWAPIADELKAFDRGIVMNSIRLRWRDVCDQLARRLDPAAVVADWRQAGPRH